jgi:mannosyltransferase OCH1-like enzyme
MYIYGGVYLDLDATIELSLSSFIKPYNEHIFFLDGWQNIQQWCFMASPKNPLILKIINEMVKRIHNHETNIFLATGPTVFSDTIYNAINNSDIYNTTFYLSSYERNKLFMDNSTFMNGLILHEHNIPDFGNKFHNMRNYHENMLYNNGDKYIVTFNEPTPFFYK